VETRGIEPLTPALQRSSASSGTVICSARAVNLCSVRLVPSGSVGTLGNRLGNMARYSADHARGRSYHLRTLDPDGACAEGRTAASLPRANSHVGAANIAAGGPHQCGSPQPQPCGPPGRNRAARPRGPYRDNTSTHHGR